MSAIDLALRAEPVQFNNSVIAILELDDARMIQALFRALFER